MASESYHSYYIYAALIFTLLCLCLSLIRAKQKEQHCLKAMQNFYQGHLNRINQK